ncbi:hypothetical protein L1987_28980 [Smallanthus sonchifolius]|uniref:Uncharacterized protein n=1 Tax=Smallanthus sonchifolius TaxID=185202 RepID=A0ACB9HZX2_9ASTR|nr:hypothetical protein L1987_28980 [Smallanthus sonchifolius]
MMLMNIKSIEGLSANASKPAHPTIESEWIHMIKSKTKALDTYMSETHELIVEGYGKYKTEEIFDAIDEGRFRLKHYGDKYNKELNEDKAAQAEKWENEEKRTQSQKMMKVEGKNNNEGAEIVDDVTKNVCKDISKQHTNETAQGEDGEKKEEKGNEKKPTQKEKIKKTQRVIQKVAKPKGSMFDFAWAVQGAKAGKTSSSKPSIQGAKASTCSVLPGLQTTGKEEKPTQVKKVKEVNAGKTTQDGEVKKEKHHKVKEVDAGEGKVDEQKVVGEDDAEVSVNVKKVNEDDIDKTAQDGEVKREKQHKVKEVDAREGKVDEQKVVGEDDAGKTTQVGGFETPTPKSKDHAEVPVNVKKVNEDDIVNVKKVNEDDIGKTAQDGEVKKKKQHKVKEVDAGEGKVDEQKVVGEDDAEQKKNAARATRPAEALCSPYVQRVVQLNTKRENIEDKTAEWIFASIEDPWIFVFQNATGINIPRICMESFHPNEYLHVNAMTCWSLVLNREEIYRSKGAPARFFCPCNMLVWRK